MIIRVTAGQTGIDFSFEWQTTPPAVLTPLLG
jgi:hypothetical protein